MKALFIELSLIDQFQKDHLMGENVAVNVSHISAISTDPTGTRVTIQGIRDIMVKQSYTEVKQMLRGEI